jgi:hypothetical protein
MGHRVFATICGAALCCVALDRAAQEASERDELERAKESLAAKIAEGMSNVEVFDTNGFHVESSRIDELGADLESNDTRFEMLNVSATDVFRVAVEKGRPMSTGGGLAIFHRGSGQPMLSAGDSDGDGSLDGLSYAKVDSDGKALLEVVDYEADGQADLRIHFAHDYSELWHVDRWYRVENRESRRGIVLNGAFVELKMERNRLIVP